MRLAVLIACLIMNGSALAACVSVLDTQLYAVVRAIRSHGSIFNFTGNEAGRFLNYVNKHSTSPDIHGDPVIVLRFVDGSASAAVFKDDCLIDIAIQLDAYSFDNAVEAAHHGEL